MKKLYILPTALFILSLFFLRFGSSNSSQIAPVQSPNPAVLGTSTPVSASESSKLYNVVKVVDGDTIEVEKDGKDYKVRYVGMDTPETVDPHRPDGCFGHEASDENKKLLEGKQVVLEKDVSETDKYGRLLRLVYLPLDDKPLNVSSSIDSSEQDSYLFVNDYLVREGFAKVLTYPPDVKFSARFTQAQQEAITNQRGLWSPSTCGGVTKGKS